MTGILTSSCARLYGKRAAKNRARKKDPNVKLSWDLASLRKRWNQEKQTVAPWWEVSSKEVYSAGIADLCAAVANWRASKNRTRKGRPVGFPRFKSRRKDPARVRFSTGAMRLGDDRRSIVVPVIGTLGSKESTRRVQRPLAQGRARILSMTLSERWGRLFVSINYAVRTSNRAPVSKPGCRAGVDLGLRTLATVADSDGNLIEYPNPTPLRATLTERRKVGRQMSRRIPGSEGHRAARTKLARMDRRAFRRSVSDGALGMFRPMLTYEMARAGTSLVTADRWYPSSQKHHDCGCQLISPTRLAKMLVCEKTGGLVDRDGNAAKNLRDWPENRQSWTSQVQRPRGHQAASRGTDPGSDRGNTHGRRSGGKTSAALLARRVEARTKTPQGEQAR